MKQAEIATFINATLTEGILSTSRFQKGLYSSIAELVPKSDEDDTTVPMIVSNTGQGEEVTVNDIYPIQIYHRIEDVGIGTDFEEGFGDNELKTETSDMIMIIIGDRLKLQLTKEDVITAIATAFPGVWTPTVDYITQTNIVMGSIDLNTPEVYNGEYNSISELPPNYFMCSISYQIVSKINQNCLELCIM